MSRDINELHPKVAEKCREFINRCKEQGIDVVITCTYRSEEEQNSLYAQGRTMPGKKITNAKGKNSYHFWRVAFDFVPIVNGKAQWNDLKLFKQCGEIAESVGLEWAGRWKSFVEYAHCQYTDGLTLADFQAGKRIV
jgi:peptidoglycan L-alanyl-D-glutamate endopeptidase CwlK